MRVWRRLPGSVERDDVIAAGMLGLLEAASRYRPGYAKAFLDNARPRIYGAIMDMLRSLDWIPRSARRRAERFEASCDALQAAHNRPPSSEELRHWLGLDVDQFERVRRDAELPSLLSLDAPLREHGLEDTALLLDRFADPDDILTRMDEEARLQRVLDAVERLPSREELAVRPFYLEDRSLRDLGRVMRCSGSRASQLQRRGVLMIRHRLREAGVA